MARCFVALFPESIKTMLFLAGLLTYSVFECLPIRLADSACKHIQRVWCGTYSSGSVRDLHPVPFLTPPRNERVSWNQKLVQNYVPRLI